MPPFGLSAWGESALSESAIRGSVLARMSQVTWEPVARLGNQALAIHDPSDLSGTTAASRATGVVMRATLDGSTDYLTAGSDPTSAGDWTGFCWCRPDALDNSYVFLHREDASVDYTSISVRSSPTPNTILLNAGSVWSTETTATFTAGELLGLFWSFSASDTTLTLRVVSSSVDETISVTSGKAWSLFNSFTVGATNTGGGALTGAIADFCVYAGTAYGVDSALACWLLNGNDPMSADAPATPSAFWPLVEDTADAVGSNDLTDQGSLAFTGTKLAVLRDQSATTTGSATWNATASASVSADLGNSLVHTTGIWFKGSNAPAGARAVVAHGNTGGGTNYHYLRLDTDGTCDFQANGNRTSGSVDVCDGAAHLCVIESNGATSRKLYIDGTQDGSTGTTSISPTFNVFNVSGFHNGASPNAELDATGHETWGAFVIAGVLDADQHAALAAGADPRLVAAAAGLTCTLYSPLGILNDGTTAQDLSGSGNHLTVAGSPTLSTAATDGQALARANVIAWDQLTVADSEVEGSEDCIRQTAATARGVYSVLPVGTSDGFGFHCAYQAPNGGNVSALFSADDGASEAQLETHTGGLLRATHPSRNATSTTANTRDRWGRGGAEWLGSTPNIRVFGPDGAMEDDTPAATTLVDFTSMAIGDGVVSGSALTDKRGRFALVASSISDNDRSSLYTWLGTPYALDAYGPYTLPASCVAAWDARNATGTVARCVGAAAFDGSTDYAYTTSPPVTSIGSAFVIGLRFKRSGTPVSTEYVMGLGNSAGSTPYVLIEIDNSGNVDAQHADGTTTATASVGGAADGWWSVALRVNADGSLDFAVLQPDEDSVTWHSSATAVASASGFDRLAFGALVRNTVAGHYSGNVAECYVATSATGTEKAAMEAFCLGAHPNSPEVDAAHTWDLQSDLSDSGSTGGKTLTDGGSLVYTGTDLVVSRDITAEATADRSHYAVGGAQFSGSNHLSASYSDPGADFYVSFLLTVPDATPAGNVTLWQSAEGSNNWRRVWLNTSGSLIANDRASGVDSSATITTALTANTPHLVVAKFAADGSSRTLWCAPVGGSLSTQSEGTTRLPTGLATLYVGAYLGTSARPESGTVLTQIKVTLASDVTDEDAFLDDLLRGKASSYVPEPLHLWELTDDTADTGSAASPVTLSWSASAAYAAEQVAGVGVPTVTGVASQYAAPIKGGAQFNGSNYVRDSSHTPVSEATYTAMWVTLPDVTPAGTVVFFHQSDGAATNRREMRCTTTSQLQIIENYNGSGNGVVTINSAFTAANVPHLVVMRCSADGASRESWIAPVGGTFLNQTNATDIGGYPATTSLTIGARDDTGGDAAEAGSVVSKVRIFSAADVTDEAAFLRALLRDWASSDVPTPIHQWDLDGDLLDSGSTGGVSLAFSASSAFGEDLIVSSHYHAVAQGSAPTWSSDAGAAEGTGAAGYLSLPNVPALYDEEFAFAARAEPDTASLNDWLIELDDGAGATVHSVRVSSTQVIANWDNRTPSSGTGLVEAAVPCTVTYWNDDTAGRIGAGHDTTEGDTSALTASPVTTRGRLMARADESNSFDGTMGRAALGIVADDRADLRAWVRDRVAP